MEFNASDHKLVKGEWAAKGMFRILFALKHAFTNNLHSTDIGEHIGKGDVIVTRSNTTFRRLYFFHGDVIKIHSHTPELILQVVTCVKECISHGYRGTARCRNGIKGHQARVTGYDRYIFHGHMKFLAHNQGHGGTGTLSHFGCTHVYCGPVIIPQGYPGMGVKGRHTGLYTYRDASAPSLSFGCVPLHGLGGFIQRLCPVAIHRCVIGDNGAPFFWNVSQPQLHGIHTQPAGGKIHLSFNSPAVVG